MAKITRTQQRRLVASSIAFILTAAIMMPMTTDARGGGGGHGGHGGGVRHIGILGSTHHHISPRVGFPFAVARVPFSSRHASLHGRAVQSLGFGSDFFPFGANGVWIDSSGSTPSIVVTQPPTILLGAAAPAHAAVVRTPPGAEQEGILVVRGTSKTYVTFPNPTPG